MLAPLSEDELDAFLRGYGHEPVYVTSEGDHVPHLEMAATLDAAIAQIRSIQDEARTGRRRPGQLEPARAYGQRWPMIVLRTPKGWTGPKEVDGLPVEGTWRAHQVPLSQMRTNSVHLRGHHNYTLRHGRDERHGQVHLVMDLIDRVPGLAGRVGHLRQRMEDTLACHHGWTREHGEDLPEVSN